MSYLQPISCESYLVEFGFIIYLNIFGFKHLLLILPSVVKEARDFYCHNVLFKVTAEKFGPILL